MHGRRLTETQVAELDRIDARFERARERVLRNFNAAVEADDTAEIDRILNAEQRLLAQWSTARSAVSRW